ncbi:MAG: hypothetical protein NC433_00815 [Clostridiales bacterium]|nr:hypothetical protein [Clostridiales bacterium]
MRSRGSIIFWIILLIWIVMNRRVNSRRNDNGNGTNMDRTPRIDNRTMQNNPANRQQPYNKQQKSQQQRPQAAAKADVEDTEPEAGSTMAYLEEKARQDAMEHAREKREEARRLNITYGGLRAAQRCYEGDSVPSDKKCIVCSYCGANNLIPQAARERYSCYFCREAL